MHILIVDDDSDDQTLFCEALREIDAEISFETAFDGEEALQRLGKSLPSPDLVFLDINMPKMDGITCLRRIRKMQGIHGIPVVVISTSILRRDEAICADLDAGHMVKPAQYSELVNLLRLCIDSFSTKEGQSTIRSMSTMPR